MSCRRAATPVPRSPPTWPYDTDLTWVTQRPPRFLADDIDGRALFDAATARRRALDEASYGHRGCRLARRHRRRPAGPHGPRSRPAQGEPDAHAAHPRRRRVGRRHPRRDADAIIWCTGFRPALSHLSPLQLRGRRGHIPTEGTQAVDEPRLHLLGYGDWTGPASATLIGVGRPASGHGPADR